MAKRKGGSNRIRIIGGEWRSRQLPFVEVVGLRPTPDRVRETLFNWLQGKVAGARCLDLFAGSGAIAFEALSRGALSVVLVEKHPAAFRQLQENLIQLDANSGTRGEVINADAADYLDRALGTFDLIFLDPPYRKGLLPIALDKIMSQSLLHLEGRLYLEHEVEESFDWSSWNLRVLKQSKAGQVCGVLLALDAPPVS